MGKFNFKIFRICVLVLLGIFSNTLIYSQIFTESMGNVAVNTAIATHESGNSFDNDTYTMTGTGDVRNTSPSSGYAGATGNGNIFLTTTIGRDFQIADINTVGCTLTSITVGIFKSTTGSDGSEIICEVSSDGTSYTALTAPALPTGAGTAIWYLRTYTGIIPATANLRVRFRQTSATVQFRVDDVALNGTCIVNTITTSAILGSPFSVTCATGSAVNVPFISTGTFNAGNIYTAQMSDAAGSFASPTNIGTLTSTANSGTINATIPANTPTGTFYRIRVVSDNPAVTGSDNGTNLTITLSGGACGITTGVIVGSPFTVDCSNWDNVAVPFTTVGTYAVGNIFSAQISDASGSFASPITIGNITLSGTDPSGSIPSTIFAGLSPGTNYRIRVVSSNPVQTGTDNGVNITINNAGSPCYGPLVVNEISQGGSGNLEYFELLVVSNNPCSTLDLRNFILDDNNGDFSGGPVAGAGIAAGHIRFSNANQWANVPSGSLIVVYNQAERNPAIPADDPSDLLVPDKVYILPANHSLLEGCITRPTATDASYSPCIYGVGTWSYISMANNADAAQVRYPNGTYSHGYSWGGAPMDGGPDAINVGTTSTSTQNIFFDNTTNNDYADVANFARGNVPADETPGAGNSAANSTFISTLICIALPVELLDFNVIKMESYNYLTWRTASEKNAAYFSIEKSNDMIHFENIGEIPAAGNSNQILNYSFADSQTELGTTYYRLKIVDFNGEFEYSQARLVTRNEKSPSPFLVGNELNLTSCESNTVVKVFDASGKLVENRNNLNGNYSLNHLENGFYLIHVICSEMEYIFKTSVSK